MFASLTECIDFLESRKQLLRIKKTVDPHLEMAEIHRQAHARGGPALFFEKVKGSPFPAVSNLFGTEERCHLILGKHLDKVRRIVLAKADPQAVLKRPWKFWDAPFTALGALPRRVRTGPVLAGETRVSALPQIVSWPKDGGPFITLPQVYTEDPNAPHPTRSNLGMYRIQLAGNRYEQDREIGLHYQIHRGIGVHHSAALARGETLPVSVFVGGPPAHTLAAIMPLPEGLTELTFAGMLGGRRFRYIRQGRHVISADADFCILGEVEPGRVLPEGPFGDHLGYYSLTHDFPVLKVKKVLHRKGAIWPFTVVGRPPQEDSLFGHLIHEITGPMVPVELPGVHSVQAVDQAGVHPLLLAVGSERYVPYAKERAPQELLTQANAILGFGQCSLAKYLLIVAQEDEPSLKAGDIRSFLLHLLSRVDWTRDLHFQTKTTIDTLDYSGTGLNSGSKLVIAAAGPVRRRLAETLPSLDLPEGFRRPKLALPGVLALEATAPFVSPEETARQVAGLSARAIPDDCPLVVLVDDAEFVARDLANFLWVTFTRSNPSHDVHGVESFTEHKHWGCRGPLVIDARIKPHHAPPLTPDPDVARSVTEWLASQGL